jgi:protein-L-isoaspartate(D-aspartate) O-methyltransferase
MAWKCGGGSNAALIENMWKARLLTNSDIRTVLLAQDRKCYTKQGAAAYEDSPQQIGWNITISAPHMHAMALEKLHDRLRPGMTALDVGSGSGYLSVAMAALVGPGGRTVGIDHIQDLVEWSKQNVARDGKQAMLDSNQLQLLCRDGFKGYPEAAPYDCIHVGAAPESVPPALKEQLKPTGGMLLLPVGPAGNQAFVRITRVGDRFEEEHLFGVRYVPLTTVEKQLRGW